MSEQEEAKEETIITLRVTIPGGRKVTLEVDPSSTTVRDLKAKLFHLGAPPPEYLRLLSRGKKLEEEDVALETLGIQHRTAIMALHNQLYVQDQEGVQAVDKILQQAKMLEDPSLAANVVHERVTQLCCQLDNVDTKGSETLRQYRKTALSQVQQVEEARSKESSTKDDDKELPK